jgi:hypothetical protein
MSRKAGESDSCSSCGLWSSVVSRHDIELCEAPRPHLGRPRSLARTAKSTTNQICIDPLLFLPHDMMPAQNYRRVSIDQHPLPQLTMALRELPSSLRRLALRDTRPTAAVAGRSWRRYTSAEAVAAAPKEVSEDFQDLESNTSMFTAFSPDDETKAYDPIKRTQGRRRELPPSRYVVEGAQHRNNS